MRETWLIGRASLFFITNFSITQILFLKIPSQVRRSVAQTLRVLLSQFTVTRHKDRSLRVNQLQRFHLIVINGVDQSISYSFYVKNAFLINAFRKVSEL